MSRRDRQRAELLALCRAGAVARAIDLAFGHLAEYGPDPHLVRQLERAAHRSSVTNAVRRRLADLRRSAS